VIFQEIFGILSGLMFPLNNLMPNRSTKFDYLHYEQKNRFNFTGHSQFHML